MADHDQRLEGLIRESLPEFVALFFPGRGDWSRLEWLDTEVFADPARGRRRTADLLARAAATRPVLPQRAGEGVSGFVIIHIEVESGDAAAGLRSRAHACHELLRSGSACRPGRRRSTSAWAWRGWAAAAFRRCCGTGRTWA